jgi:hypothetical protein
MGKKKTCEKEGRQRNKPTQVAYRAANRSVVNRVARLVREHSNGINIKRNMALLRSLSMTDAHSLRDGVLRYNKRSGKSLNWKDFAASEV